MLNTLSSQSCRNFRPASGAGLFFLGSMVGAGCRACRYFSDRNCRKRIGLAIDDRGDF